MKRIVSIFVLVVLVLSSFASCDVSEVVADPTSAALNLMISNTPYSSIDLDISVNGADGVSSNGEYTLAQTEDGLRIDYKVEQLLPIEINNGIINSDSSYKKVATGYAIVDDFGMVSKQEGDLIDLNAIIGLPNFEFKSGDFEDIFEEPGEFICIGDSTSRWASYTAGVSADSDITVKVAYEGAMVTSITIIYTSEELCEVTATYTYN